MTFTTVNLPVPTPETAPFWDGIALGKLRLPRCLECSRWFFPPSIVCPSCTSRDVEWSAASGRGTLFSYVIAHRPLPEWHGSGPMSVALIQLEEGPRLVSTVVDCEQIPGALILDMPLVAVYRDFADRKMLCFAPDNGARA